MVNRRSFLRNGLAAGGALLGAPMISRGRYALCAGGREYSRRAVDLVQDSLVVDMLGLVTLDWAKLDRWEQQPNAFRKGDYEKLLRSGITVFHPAVDLNASDPFRATREWLRDWNGFIAEYPQWLIRVDSVADLLCAKAQRRVGIIHGFQNSSHFRTVTDVSFFYGLGQRISQLTYNEVNQVGCGCTAPKDSGLTPFGTSVVAEMNRLGMAIDVSHSGDLTTREAIAASRKPILVTHSNCRSLNRHPRCKPDETIRLLASRGGVFGVTGIRRFVRSQEPTTIEDVLDHFDHVRELVGIEHAGLGSDNDLDGRDHQGITRQRMDIDGLDHPRRVYDLTEGLIRRGYSDSSIRLILGGNIQRVLTEIWAV